MEDCPRLAMLQEKPSAQPLHGLHTLALVRCHSLKQLPCISMLVGLRQLSVQECHSFKQLPPSIGDLSSLHKLDLRGCRSLKQLSSSISRLTSLRDLCMAGCISLEKVPEEIGTLTSLTLYLDGCTSLDWKKLPRSIRALVHSPISNETQGWKREPRSSSHNILRLSSQKMDFRRSISEVPPAMTNGPPTGTRSVKWKRQRTAAAQAFASIRRFKLSKVFSKRKQRLTGSSKRAGWFSFGIWRVWR